MLNLDYNKYIERSLVLNVQHLDLKDVEFLKSHYTFWEDGYSFRLRVDEDTEISNDINMQTNLLIELCKDNNIDMIVFDCDGEVSPSLKKFGIETISKVILDGVK